MNKIKKLTVNLSTILFILLSMTFAVSAQNETAKDNVTYKVYPEAGIMIFSGEGEIPKDYFGFQRGNQYASEWGPCDPTEEEIEQRKEAESVKTLIIEEGITKVGEGAFNSEGNGFINLETLILPESLEEIGRSSFAGCGKLTRVYLPSSLKTISVSAFEKTGIKNIVIPESVENLECPFNGCNSLKTITFTNASCRVEDCKSLTKIVYANPIKEAKVLAINCPNLKTVTFQNLEGNKKVKVVSSDLDMLFENCPNVKLGYLDESAIDTLEKNGIKYAVVTSKASSLGEVKNLKYTQYGFNMKISWSAVKNAGYYQLYYYNGSKWQLVYSGEKTSFSAPNFGKFELIEDGKYRVRAVSYDGKEYTCGKFSGLNIKSVGYTQFKSLTKKGTNVTLTWDKVNDATGYIIYDVTKGQKKICNVTGTSYTLQNLEKGKIYSFRVRAYRKDKDGSIKYSSYSIARSIKV